jgi:tRNA modification GTPase
MARSAGTSLPADTIAAIATPAGTGAIGVVRISGPCAAQLAEALLGALPRPRHATFASFRDAHGAAIDEGIALYFPGPRSFTGEDMLELHAHGGTVVLDMLLQRVLALGARLARPGEFSERAFFNGKIDLTQAEAIADLISSGSAQAARAAIASLHGEFSRRIHAIAAAIDAMRAEVEAWLDFPEEDPDRSARLRYEERAQSIVSEITATLTAAREGQLLNDGIRVVLIGRPNAGKSSLFNCLARRDRAIVSEQPGTTRDTLDVDISVGGLPVHLTDTAGLRDSADSIELEGMRRAREAVQQADHIVLLIPCDEAYTDADRRLLADMPTPVPVTVARTKIDLCAKSPYGASSEKAYEVWLSAVTGSGVELLEQRLQDAAGFHAPSEGAFAARRRHLVALTEVRAALLAGLPHLRSDASLELAAEHLRNARQYLSTITGEHTTEDLLGQIFSTFCIGK